MVYWGGLGRLQFRRTTVIIAMLAAFLAGLGLARTRYKVSLEFVWLSLLLCAVTFRRRSVALLISFTALGLSLGWWRGSAYLGKLTPYHELIKRPVIVTGRADTDGVYTTGSQLGFDLANVKVQDPVQQRLVGKIGVKGFGEYAVYRGDTVQVEGKLYPTRGARQASISFAQIKVLRRSGSPVESIRRHYQSGMFSALPEPLASFALGLLIGQRSTLPQSVSDQLTTVGLTHIVAVSGYNLTIIMGTVYLLLRQRSKYQSTVISLALIGLFLLFAGFSASIVRAAIVSMLSIAAAYYGRTFRPLVLILLAACVTAGWFPLYLWSDLGWYLSFLAFFGVLVLAPLLIKRIYKGKQPQLLAAVIIETLCAQIMTLPLIMYIFGNISLISLPANVLIVPLVPLGMAVAFAAGLGGMLTPFISGWIAWPARVLLTYMLDVIGLLAQVPHALSHRTLSAAYMLVLYAVVSFICLLLWMKTRTKSGIITDIEALPAKGASRYERTL
jgi:competence protein ComEC